MTDQNRISGISRRNFLRASGFAVTLPMLGQLVACSGGGGALGSGGANELVIPFNTSPWGDAYKRIAALYKEETGVRVTLREFPTDGLHTAMINAIRGGNKTFDVFHLDEPWTGEFYSNGWAAPFTDVDPAFTLDPEIGSYSDLPYWDSSTRTGSAAGDVVSLPINGSMTLFMYRKDLYDDLGLSVPTTFEEAYANGRAAQEAGAVRYGYVARGQGVAGSQTITFDFMPLLFGYGGEWFDEDYNSLVNKREAIEALEMYKRLLTLGPSNPSTVDLATVIATMQSGDALQGHVVAVAAAQLDDESKSNVAGRVGFAPMPAGPAGSVPISNVWSLAIPKANSPQRQKAALDYITWLLQKTSQTTFTNAGGIPTRADVLAEEAANHRSLAAVSASLKSVRSALRYTFTPEMVNATEPALSSMANGRNPVEAGMSDLANELTGIARKAGYGN